MTKEKNKRNVAFSLYSEALPLASPTVGCAALFWEVLGKGPAAFPSGAFGSRCTQGLRCGCRGRAVPLLPATPQQGQAGDDFLCAWLGLREPSAVCC